MSERRRPCGAERPVPEYSDAEIRQAQEALDFYPSKSPYWEQMGQDDLAVIHDLKLEPATTEWERIQNERRALLGSTD